MFFLSCIGCVRYISISAHPTPKIHISLQIRQRNLLIFYHTSVYCQQFFSDISSFCRLFRIIRPFCSDFVFLILSGFRPPPAGAYLPVILTSCRPAPEGETCPVLTVPSIDPFPSLISPVLRTAIIPARPRPSSTLFDCRHPPGRTALGGCLPLFRIFLPILDFSGTACCILPYYSCPYL